MVAFGINFLWDFHLLFILLLDKNGQLSIHGVTVKLSVTLIRVILRQKYWYSSVYERTNVLIFFKRLDAVLFSHDILCMSVI